MTSTDEWAEFRKAVFPAGLTSEHENLMRLCFCAGLLAGLRMARSQPAKIDVLLRDAKVDCFKATISRATLN